MPAGMYARSKRLDFVADLRRERATTIDWKVGPCYYWSLKEMCFLPRDIRYLPDRLNSGPRRFEDSQSLSFPAMCRKCRYQFCRRSRVSPNKCCGNLYRTGGESEPDPDMPRQVVPTPDIKHQAATECSRKAA